MNRKNNISVKKITMEAALLALGVVLPQIMHLGGPNVGRVFLPMHLNVLLGGLLLGPVYGAGLGAFTPVLSAVLTGMPVMHKLPFMMIELIAYGTMAGILSNKKISIYVKLIIAQVTGRIIYGLVLMLGIRLLNINVSPVTSIITGVITGLPGIIIQIIFVPMLIMLIQNMLHFDMEEFGEK